VKRWKASKSDNSQLECGFLLPVYKSNLRWMKIIINHKTSSHGPELSNPYTHGTQCQPELSCRLPEITARHAARRPFDYMDITTPCIFFTEFGHTVFEKGLNLGTIFHKRSNPRSNQLLIKYAWILRFSCIILHKCMMIRHKWNTHMALSHLIQHGIANIATALPITVSFVFEVFCIILWHGKLFRWRKKWSLQK
jgi:hypothetical protein